MNCEGLKILKFDNEKLKIINSIFYLKT